MKIILGFLLINIFVVGCASKQKVKKQVAVEDVTTEDFKKVKEVKYTDASDEFGEVDDQSTEALNKESIQRLKDPSDLKASTLLDEIIINCYNKDFEKAFNI